MANVTIRFQLSTYFLVTHCAALLGKKLYWSIYGLVVLQLLGLYDAKACWFVRFFRITLAVSEKPYSIKIFSIGEKGKYQKHVRRRKKYFVFLGKFNKYLIAFKAKGYLFTDRLIFFLNDR
jgi:hypothetical protein